MAIELESSEVISSLLLVKAVIAVLATLLFVYYKFYWEKAKRHLPIHYFYAKWRAVRHAVALGAASAGFAIGFTLELFGEQFGFSANKARFFSSIFEIGSLFAMLFVFFELALEDVPHFQRISDSSAQTVAPHSSPPAAQKKAHSYRAPAAKPKKMNASKIRRKK